MFEVYLFDLLDLGSCHLLDSVGYQYAVIALIALVVSIWYTTGMCLHNMDIMGRI